MKAKIKILITVTTLCIMLVVSGKLARNTNEWQQKEFSPETTMRIIGSTLTAPQVKTKTDKAGRLYSIKIQGVDYKEISDISKDGETIIHIKSTNTHTQDEHTLIYDDYRRFRIKSLYLNNSLVWEYGKTQK